MSPRNWEKSKFKKTIGISKSDHDYIQKIKGRKSLSGALAMTIEFYRRHNQYRQINENELNKSL